MDRDAERRCAGVMDVRWLPRRSTTTTTSKTNTITQPTMGRSSCGSNGSITFWRTPVSFHLFLQPVDESRCHPYNLQQDHHSLPGCLIQCQFARDGIPKGLCTDNGSNLVPKEVEEFLKEMAIEHRNTRLSMA